MKKTLILVAVLIFTVILSNSIKAQNTNASNKNDVNSQNTDYDQNIKIKKKPPVSSTQSQVDPNRYCSLLKGVTRLRATFDKSAKVTDAEIVSSSGCDDFDQTAVRAAKKIKFKPAMKNGESVTITKFVEYAFTVHNSPN